MNFFCVMGLYYIGNGKSLRCVKLEAASFAEATRKAEQLCDDALEINEEVARCVAEQLSERIPHRFTATDFISSADFFVSVAPTRQAPILVLAEQ